jgi:hypothetical protein
MTTIAGVRPNPTPSRDDILYGALSTLLSVDDRRITIAAALALIEAADLPVQITPDSIQFNIAPADTTAEEGKLLWDEDARTLSFGLPGGNVSMRIGQAMVLPRKVRNDSGFDMPAGALVYISGVLGQRAIVSLAKADTEATSSTTIAMLAEDIDDGEQGYAVTTGVVFGTDTKPIDTDSFALGDPLWLSATVAGGFTNSKPASPSHAVLVGYVWRKSATVGEIYVKIQNGWELYEIHDVSDALVTPVAGELFGYNASTTLWEQTSSLVFDFINERLGIGDTTPDTRLEVAGAITIQELSTDPADPVEGKAVFWKSDGTGTGNDGDLLYMEQSAATVATGCLKWADFTPTSITDNASDGTTGTVSDVQVMFDGNFYQVEEAAATPGFDQEFVFSGVDRYPTIVVTRWIYNGSATHNVTWAIWNYNTSAWDDLRVFQDSNGYYASMTMYIPRASNGNYVSGGAAKIRAYHNSAGNASHNIKIDYVGLTHSLQGVI